MPMTWLYFPNHKMVSKVVILEVNFKKTKVMILQKHKSKPKNIKLNIGNSPISITYEYTYLGVKLTPNTNFKNACQQLSEKAIHALYKICKQLDFHKLPPKLACKIFDGVISPILLYNSEIWGAYALTKNLQNGIKLKLKKHM